MDKLERIVDRLADEGWLAIDGMLDPELVAELAAEALDGWSSGAFRQAKIGLGAEEERHPEIRSDFIHWLYRDELTPAQQRYYALLDRIRDDINRSLFLGLFEFEGHLALYPEGAFYGPHMDRFEGTRHRVVTAILYLNDDWRPEDGGQLRIYLDERGIDGEHRDILPQAGRMMIFLTERFLHEVLPAKRPRLSLTGWFRVRPLLSEADQAFIAPR